ncbi:MAG: DUF6599 family protein [Candidatus Zixiibacteriota bacterium]
MINRKITLLLVVIIVAVGLYWFYSSKDSGRPDRQKALEEKISKIPFEAERLLPTDSADLKVISSKTQTTLKRSEISDSTLTDAGKYLNSLVVGLTRKSYQAGDELLNVEIAQFASPNDAYGFYSQNRPDGAPFDTLGTESFFAGNIFNFTKSSYVVLLSSNAPESKYAPIKQLARLIDEKITERSVQPLFFRLFPYRGQFVPSQKYFSLDFLGVSLLDEVYTLDYLIDEDTLTLFLTSDTSGEKFLMLSEWGKNQADFTVAPKEFMYPENFSLSFNHPQYGQIVAGLVSRKLAGVIGYKRATGIELCSKWILDLQ